ncbi:uncharacterized protein LOC143017219 [Genypterus blacodes]|uniref:uncharacterized protein LOC143017219 n=1 Tax=Genypterus blacodes TaxID=154954 RepID=UPI003F770363
MDVLQLVALSLCWWAVAARSSWSNKPFILLSSTDIREGETLKVSCGVPIDYTGGNCRLFQDRATAPFKLQVATPTYVCDFLIGSEELLGRKPGGRRVHFRCDYKLQGYTSELSDQKSVIVWRSMGKPSLSVGRHFVGRDESVEVVCSPPPGHDNSCYFYRDEDQVTQGSCRKNVSGRLLSMYDPPSLLHPVRLSCDYWPNRQQFIRSQHSQQQLLFVVDTSQVKSSLTCRVSVDQAQLAALTNSSRTFVRADGLTVTFQATNSSLSLNQTCHST